MLDISCRNLHFILGILNPAVDKDRQMPGVLSHIVCVLPVAAVSVVKEEEEEEEEEASIVSLSQGSTHSSYILRAFPCKTLRGGGEQAWLD